ncbi:MAG: hypothetical protein M1818_003912 [Claussenomyces sp. TS43310]|nr:MAG: hypothetical protein M1818_003912 [Claussenomyces sp. TS43310]
MWSLQNSFGQSLTEGSAQLRSLPCHYDGERQPKRKLESKELEKRLHRMESLFQRLHKEPDSFVPRDSSEPVMEALSQGSSGTTISDDPSAYIDGVPRPVPLPKSKSCIEGVAASTDTEELDSGRQGTSAKISGVGAPSAALPRTAVSSGEPVCLLDQILSSHGRPIRRENNAAIWNRTLDGDDYTGPSSGLSLLSDPGLEWIQHNFDGSGDICVALRSVTADFADHLQRPKCIPMNPWASPVDLPRPKPLPQLDLFWKYIDAYFKHVQWALLSAETPEAYEESGREGWEFFQISVDLISQLVYKPTNIIVVQALAIMAVYAQGLSSPQRLEYTFTVLAAQLAQALGMHRQALESWHLSTYEIQERNRLFWVIYILDKTVALRSGRPSVIDDECISCDFPSGTTIIQTEQGIAQNKSTQGEGSRFDFFLSYAQYARLCSRIAKQLYCASALSRPAQELLATAAQIDDRLQAWREGIPSASKPRASSKLRNISCDVPFIQALVLNFSYNYAVCAIYRRFSAMFLSYELSSSFESVQAVQLMTGTKVIEAARSMVLLMKHLDIESYGPGWLLFYYPVTALLAIFTQVVCHPSSDTASNDIALMDVVVGHLGRLEFVTAGGTAFNKIADLVRLARDIVKKFRQKREASPSAAQWLTGSSRASFPENSAFEGYFHTNSNSDSAGARPNPSISYVSRQDLEPEPDYGQANRNAEDGNRALGQDGQFSMVLGSNPQPDWRQTQGTMTTNQFPGAAAANAPSSNACLNAQDILPWQVQPQPTSHQEWSFSSIDFHHGTYGHHVADPFTSRESKLV